MISKQDKKIKNAKYNALIINSLHLKTWKNTQILKFY
jgi:hypothetical protein